jgi:hypothetical protein
MSSYSPLYIVRTIWRTTEHRDDPTAGDHRWVYGSRLAITEKDAACTLAQADDFGQPKQASIQNKKTNKHDRAMKAFAVSAFWQACARRQRSGLFMMIGISPTQLMRGVPCMQVRCA